MEWSGDYGTSNPYIAYQIGIEETDYSISDNTSTFRTQIFIYRTNTGYTTYGSGTVYYRLKTSVGDVSDWYTYNLTTDDKITSDGIYVAEDTWGPRIHNAEGDLDVTLECYIEHDTFSSDSNEFTISTTHIPRTSQPSLDAYNVDFGDEITIYTNRASSSFTHHLYYSFNGGDAVGITAGFGDSYTWTIPTDLMNKIPNNTSSNITFYLYTFGDSLIGCKTITFTATVPSSAVPKISDIDCMDPYKYEATYGAYVQNKSKVKVTVTAAGCYSSTIKNYKITANGENYAFNGATTDVLTTAGENTINVSVTDSRGRTVTKTITINVLAYSAPDIEKLAVVRCISDGTPYEEGAYMKVTYKASITALNDKNNKVFTLQYKMQNATYYTTHLIYKDDYTWEGTAIISADVDYGYNVLLVVQDAFSTTSQQVDVSTAFALIDFNASGKGISFGKASERDGFECKLNAIFEGMVEGVYPVGSIYISTINVNPSEYFGGIWVEWGSGRVPVGVDTNDEDFDKAEKIGGDKTHVLTEDEMPSHNHKYFTNLQHSDGELTSKEALTSGLQVGGRRRYVDNTENTGGGQAHSILQPYITCYMWKRTA